MKTLEEIKRLNNEKVNEEQLDQLLESELVTDYDYMTSGQYDGYMVYTLSLKDGEEVEVYCKYKGEYEDLDELLEIDETLNDLNEHEINHLLAYMEATDNDLENSIGEYENNSFYWCGDLVDVARKIIEDQYSNSFLLSYFDYEAFANDLSINGYYETKHGTVEIY